MSTVSKYDGLKTVNEEVITDEMLKRLVETSPERQQDWWIRDVLVGNVCVYFDDRYPDYVLELVMGAEESSVSTLFMRHPTFTARKSLAGARKELITEIGVATMSLPSRVAIRDEGRGRDVALAEMSTAQLVDILASATVGKLAVQ